MSTPFMIIQIIQMVRKISQSQSSYRTKPDIIIDEVYDDDDGVKDSICSDKESGWLVNALMGHWGSIY